MFLTPIWNGFLNRKTFLFQLSRLCDLIPFLVIFILAQPCVTNAQIDRTVSELETKSVILTCPVNEAKCGKLHSLNWFKGEDRIAAMLLGETNVMNVNEKYQNRVTVVLNPYRLIINDLQIGDEDIYLCDTTFFIPEESCDNFNGYRIELRVLVPPSEVIILDAKGDRIENGNTVGPMQERQSLKATCTVKNTRPQPEVGWFRGSKRLTTYSPTHDIKDGLFTSTLELDWSLSREDLAQEIECRVKSAAMPETIVKKFSINLQVRPTSIEMNGVEHHTVQGSKVILTCDIHGARPPVNLTWYNVTTPITTEENILTEIRTKAFEKNDGTYHTQSELIFNATRFENDRVFRCEAENIVIQINREKPISSALTLEVLYPPVVKVSPPEVVTNTSEIVLLNCEYVANPASLTNVVWYRNNEVVNVNNTDRYQGGNSENVALVIKSTEKDDTGNYSCQLSNSIGKGVSEQEINLDVQYVPIVEVVMIPEGPVKESDESNVTLFCNIIGANPSLLTKVRWYANSTLLKELPDCEETNEDLCHIDPSKLLLESIGRGFFYNYSCEGLNAAGWGPRSEDKELMVHYEPGPASLSNFPLIAVKKKSVVLTCSVDDPGYPDSNRYRWLRGGRGPLQDVVTKDWTVEPVGLDSRTNYSCYAYNEGGRGIMATVNLKVHAPPFFIKNLPPYTGILHSSTNANLTCRIECVPRCEISWLKGGIPIEKNNTKYFVKEKYMESSPATGDFESMLSVLHFNMSNWPQQKFDIEADNDNYTCLSTSNSVGPSVKSSTYFSIEYSPINTTVSEENVYIEEDTKPERIFCNARANPEPSYKWIFKNETIANGNFLTFDFGLRRNQNGIYSCMAYNKHGNDLAHTVITVQFKPDCNIKRENINGQDTLVCTAFGKPSEADFSWSIKGENETIENLGSGYPNDLSDKSFYVLKADYGITRTYRCLANNTVGSGTFCEIEVDVRPKKQLAWWQRWEENTLVILLTGILVLLLIVVIICCIIIYVCRRRRRQDKLHDKSSSMGEPLTEPCEYENLPFHGLQTAPNKLYNTPTSLNNNVNVICGGSQSKKVNKDYNPVLNSDPHLQKKTPLGQPISPSTFSVECTASKGPRQGKSQNVSNFSLEPNLNLQICVSKINTSNATKNHHHQEFGNTLNVKTKKLNNKSSKLYSSIDKVHNHPTDVKKIPLETSVSSNNPCHAANSVHKYDNGIQNIREKTNKSNFNVEKEFQLLKSSEEIQFKTKYVGDSKTCFTESLSVEGVGILPKCQKHYPFMSNRNGNIYSSRQSIHLHDLHCGNLGEKRLENPDECVSGIGIQKNIKYMGNAHLHSNSKEKKYIYPKKLSPEIKCGAVETDANLQFLKPESYMIYRSDSGISNSSQESQMQPSLPPLRRSKYTKIQLENSPTSYKNRKIVHKPECGKSHHQNYLDEIGSKGFGNKDFDSISSPEKNNPKQFERPSKNSKEENYYHQKKITRQSATPVFKFWKETNFVNPNGQLNCKVSGTLVESRQHRNTIPHQNERTKFRKFFEYNDICIRKKLRRKYRRLTICDPYTLTQLQKLKKSSEKIRSTGNSLITNSSKIETIDNKDHCKIMLPRERLQTNLIIPFLSIDNLQSIPKESITKNVSELNLDGAYDCMVVRRPIRLPLRKHHTFHFQNVQTANGKLQELRKKLYQNRQKMIVERRDDPLTNRSMNLNENNGFMPISPTPTEPITTHLS
nr:hemicentin-1 isoform X5 [Drosophila bipectinata]